MSITLSLPSPPSSNRYWRNYNGRIVVSQEAKAYKAECGWMAKSQMDCEPLTGDVAVSVRWFRPARRGDLQNRQKIFLDALQGIAYVDDKQVAELHMYRDYDKANPRIEVEIWEVG